MQCMISQELTVSYASSETITQLVVSSAPCQDYPAVDSQGVNLVWSGWLIGSVRFECKDCSELR